MLPIIEAAGAVIANPNIHSVTRTFPRLVEAVEAKRNWWNNDVPTFAAEDNYKSVGEILALGWREYEEAEEATPEHKLVELGDVVVFLSGAISRGMLPNSYDSTAKAKELERQLLFLAHYVFTELGKIDITSAYEKMIRDVFYKIQNNFHPPLNPRLPETAGREQVSMIYRASYGSSRALRQYAAQSGIDIVNTGLPMNWKNVYSFDNIPHELIRVKQVVLKQMVNVGTSYKAAFGSESIGEIFEYWEITAPAMVEELRKLLII